jgi:hypoxanthine phosphoribosyltransferase
MQGVFFCLRKELQNRESIIERIIEVSKFQISASAEVRVQVAQKENHVNILLTLYQRGTDGEFIPTEHKIEIPSALFPELTRTMETLDRMLTSQHLSGDFEDSEEEPKEGKKVHFAHPSEEEFAKLLDFYRIQWQYEPRTFAVRWDDEGKVIESFTPDFYLPDHDLFIELTTLKQELVTKKNRKVRHLKELYPEINVKVMYARDYKRLLEKFAGGMNPEGQKQRG